MTEGRFYFLARPRRFGKSLLVSTLKCLFAGQRDLFDGLWIAQPGEWDWQAHPVVLLDFNGINCDSPASLRTELKQALNIVARTYDFQLEGPSPLSQFKELITGLYARTGAAVVVLIDEYDKPIIRHLGPGANGLVTAIANRDILRSFYGVLKDASVSAALGFVLLTGVSQFSKVPIFSELNNLNDISMHEDYADMLGYTQAELEHYFKTYIQQLAAKLGWSEDALKTKLAQQYNGYRFSEADIRVYNPFSILKAFNHKRLKNYWFETGTPTFLVNLLKQEQYDLPKIENLQIDSSIFTAFQVDNLNPEALLFQTGYLTIKDVADEIYTLGYPNQEVKTAFLKSLLFSTAAIKRETSSHVLWLSKHLQAEDLPAFFETMTAIFAAIPYDIESKWDEAYFHALFYLMVSASGGAAQSNVLTCRGRIDLVVTFPDKVYLIEFKCNHGASVALKQIRDKGYAEPYRQSDRKIILLGINFSTETRNIAEWQMGRVPDQGQAVLP